MPVLAFFHPLALFGRSEANAPQAVTGLDVICAWPVNDDRIGVDELQLTFCC